MDQVETAAFGCPAAHLRSAPLQQFPDWPFVRNAQILSGLQFP